MEAAEALGHDGFFGDTDLVASTLRGVRSPLQQPALHLRLESWYLGTGFLDKGRGGFRKDLFDLAFSFVKQEQFDDRYDRARGMNGPLVKHATTTHPRPFRIEYGVCHGFRRGGGRSALVSYPATVVPPQLWSKRHLPPSVFALMAHVCVVLRPHVQCLCSAGLPNSLTVHWYPSRTTVGNERGDCGVGYHTDSYSASGRRVAQRHGTPVVSISFGETMWFWVRTAQSEDVATALGHGSVWIWSSADDKCGVKHSVRYESNRAEGSDRREGEGRWVIIGRWIDTVREYNCHYPYRNCSGQECAWINPQ